MKIEDVGVLVARILMPILFYYGGLGKITGYAGNSILEQWASPALCCRGDS